MPTIIVSITDTADDGRQFLDQSAFLADGIRQGSNYRAGFRFLNVTVPQGATIESATLSCNCYSASGSNLGNFYGADVDTAPPFSSSFLPINAEKTSASIALANGSTGPHQYDATAIVQEIVSRSGWASGNALAIIGDNAGSNGELFLYDYQDGGENQAQLSVTYTEGGGSPTLAPLTLSNSTVAEDAAAGAVVGAIQGTTSGSTLSLMDDAGGKFVIDGGNIEVAGALDYDAATSHSITIRETLSGATNTPNDTVLSITVTNVSEGGGGTPAFSEGFNFRSTSAYVTDPADTQFVGMELYPTTANGATFGWNSANGLSVRNRSTAYDPRIAGVVFRSNSAASYFRVDLPAPGEYDITIALGDVGSTQTGQYGRILDDATVLATLGANQSSSNTTLYDATNVQVSRTVFFDQHTKLRATFASPIFIFQLGGGGYGVNDALAHIAIESVASGGEPEPTPAPFFSYWT